MLDPKTLTPNEVVKLINCFSNEHIKEYLMYLINLLNELGHDCDTMKMQDVVDIEDYESACYMSEIRRDALNDIGNIIDRFDNNVDKLLNDISQILNEKELELGR